MIAGGNATGAVPAIEDAPRRARGQWSLHGLPPPFRIPPGGYQYCRLGSVQDTPTPTIRAGEEHLAHTSLQIRAIFLRSYPLNP